MMNLPQLPQPPTDNLYKFMAIFGLTLLIVGIVLPVYITHYERMLDVEAKARISAIDIEMVKSGAFDALKNLPEDASPEEKASYEAKRLDFLTKNNQTMEELRVLLARKPFVYSVLIGSGIMSIMGFVMVYKGFSLWYHRLQKYQDITLRNQAKITIKESKRVETKTIPKRRTLGKYKTK